MNRMGSSWLRLGVAGAFVLAVVGLSLAALAITAVLLVLLSEDRGPAMRRT